VERVISGETITNSLNTLLETAEENCARMLVEQRLHTPSMGSNTLISGDDINFLGRAVSTNLRKRYYAREIELDAALIRVTTTIFDVDIFQRSRNVVRRNGQETFQVNAC